VVIVIEYEILERVFIRTSKRPESVLILTYMLSSVLGAPPAHILMGGPNQLPLYSCPVLNCGASYTRNNNLKVHLLTKHVDLDTKNLYLTSSSPSLAISIEQLLIVTKRSL